MIELNLPKEGVLILGVHACETGHYIGAPTASCVIKTGDTVVLYGPIDRLKELDQRRSGAYGDEAHEAAISYHADILEQQHPKTT